MTIFISSGLPDFLAQGVFKESKTYPVIIGLSTAPGAIISDGQPTFRGMAIKIIGVEGSKFLPEEFDAVTQDFFACKSSSYPNRSHRNISGTAT